MDGKKGDWRGEGVWKEGISFSIESFEEVV